MIQVRDGEIGIEEHLGTDFDAFFDGITVQVHQSGCYQAPLHIDLPAPWQRHASGENVTDALPVTKVKIY